MGIQISRSEVLNNLIHLKHKLLQLKKGKKRGWTDKRLYRALLNRHTGDIRFIDEAAQFKISSEWKEIHIDVIETAENEPARFEAADEKSHPIELEGLDLVAWRILAETVETLNLMAGQNFSKKKGILPEEAALENLSEIHLCQMAGKIEELEGWHGDIDRFEAEKRLGKQMPGTYLLRGVDSLTQALTKGLADANRISLKAYAVTERDVENKITDRILLETQQGWTIYRGNPKLSDLEYVYYNSPEDALQKLFPRAKKPLQAPSY